MWIVIKGIGQDISMPSLSQSREYLNNRKNESNIVDTQRAYKLLKRDEELKKKNKIFGLNYNY